DVGRHGQRQRRQHREEPSAGQIRTDDQKRRQHAQDRAGGGHHRRQPQSPDGQPGRPDGEHLLRDPRPSGLGRPDRQVGHRNERDRHCHHGEGEQQRPARALADHYGTSPDSLISAIVASSSSRSLRSTSGAVSWSSGGTYAGGSTPATTGYSFVSSAKYFCASSLSRYVTNSRTSGFSAAFLSTPTPATFTSAPVSPSGKKWSLALSWSGVVPRSAASSPR